MANRNSNKAAGDYPGYRHPKVLIGYVVWSYHRFTLSLRDISEQLLMRGIIVSYETIGEWSLEFGMPMKSRDDHINHSAAGKANAEV